MFDYFGEITKACKNLASKADLLFFEGPIAKKDHNEIVEDCLIVACFYMSAFKSRSPFVLDFLSKENVKDKLTKEDRKQTGSFFTPPYIAEYIVANTIGPLVNDIKKLDITNKEKIEKICNLKICDPACGGAIFLICAHDFLMEECLKIASYEFEIEVLSSMASKAIFGVDLNPKAIEFSKFILNVNIAKWKLLDKMNEFASIAESDLNLPNPKCDNDLINGHATAHEAVQKKLNTKKITKTKEKKKLA
jgi:type I restriction-modification system DNA methylase subunit